MIRSFIITINLFIALIVKMLADDPTAEVKAPATVKQGESFVVEVVIHTNDQSDFMRYSMELPAGWTAEKITTDGGSFKFDKHAAKFLWSTVNGIKDLHISFKVIPPATAEGAFSFPSKISYPVDNLPANVDVAPLSVTIEKPTEDVPVAVQKHVPDSTAKPPVALNIQREVPTEPVKGEFNVNVIINKDDLTSFGKFEDSLPSGFTATLLKSDGANFAFENGVVKFSWFVLPAKHTLNVQYKVTASPDMSGPQTISGHFSYVENETGKLLAVPSSIVTLEEIKPVVVNTTPPDNTNTTSPDNSKTTTPDNSKTVTTTTPDNSKTTNTTTPDNSGSIAKTTTTTNTTQPVTTPDNTQTSASTSNTPDVNAKTGTAAGVSFSVQIAAMSRMVPVAYFQDKYHLSGINAEQDNGLNKYTTGTFPTYQAAHDHREEVKNSGVSDAFVTAYNSGKRITVQEALMITSQKWVR